MAVALYCLTIAVAVKFFLSELVFLAVPLSETNESRSFVVKSSGAEALIRVYESDPSGSCAIYFPGQHGGIPRYEKELFKPAVKRGITVYAISYPGYEGAAGKATFETVKATTKLAIERIEQDTSCVASESVFIGRSLGSAVALQNALIFKPKGLLLDSASPSLGPVIKEKLSDTPILWPAQFLPINKLLEFDVHLKDGFRQLENTPIVLVQGRQDRLAKPQNIEGWVKHYANVDLVMVDDATHSNVVTQAGSLYFEKLCQLLECRD